MKKINKILFVGCCLLALPALADLEGGTIVTARGPADEGCTPNTCNGRKFYVSQKYQRKGLNWWSAFTWCRSNGLELATLAEACPPGNSDEQFTCPNLRGLLEEADPDNSGSWIKLSHTSASRMACTLDNAGTVECRRSKTDAYYHALCIMPEETTTE